MSTVTAQTVTLNNGVEIPALGLGVFQTPPDETRAAVGAGLAAGYRHIDTAAAYGNERQVGEAVVASDLNRSEVFLETKIWISDYGYGETLHGFEKSARKRGVSQIDLLILHQPLPSAFDRTLAAYRALETLLADGKVRAIGVSNFMVKHLTMLLDRANVVPAVNQIEVHPYFAQRDVQTFGAEHGILVADRWHHLLSRRQPRQHARRPGHRRHRQDPRQESGPGDAPVGFAARTLGHSEVDEAQPYRREHRRLRRRTVRRGSRGDRRARHRRPWRPGPRDHHPRGVRRRHPGGLDLSRESAAARIRVASRTYCLGSAPVLRIGSIVLRVDDLRRQTEFWQAALGYVRRDDGASDDFVLLGPPDDLGPYLSLDQVRSDLQIPPRLHLDLYTEDQAREVKRLIALGATEVFWDRRPPDADYVILADPEGNRFCVVDTRH